MENLNGFHPTAGYSDDRSSLTIPLPPTSHAVTQQYRSSSSSSIIMDAMPPATAVEVPRLKACMEEDDVAKALRDKIAFHPLYPKLLYAYIDCQKVGAPPEMAKVLDEIGRECCDLWQRSACLSDDPELDDFMEMYCDLLVKLKSDLWRPFTEATAFLNNMELQLNDLCHNPTSNYIPDEAAGSCEEDFTSRSKEEKEASELKRINEDRELKDELLRRYAGYIGSLKHEFSKQKKKEKLPKEATEILLAWWNIHFRWPYPTEEDKVALAEWTGLDQKQINNWFINQRKRHWKPTTEEIMHTAVLDGLYGPFTINND